MNEGQRAYFENAIFKLPFIYFSFGVEGVEVLTLGPRLTAESGQSFCLGLPSAGITGVSHQIQLFLFKNKCEMTY